MPTLTYLSLPVPGTQHVATYSTDTTRNWDWTTRLWSWTSRCPSSPVIRASKCQFLNCIFIHNSLNRDQYSQSSRCTRARFRKIKLLGSGCPSYNWSGKETLRWWWWCLDYDSVDFHCKRHSWKAVLITFLECVAKFWNLEWINK